MVLQSGLHSFPQEDIYKAKMGSYFSSITQQIMESLKYVQHSFGKIC